jgi:hypothetical protein
VQEQARRDFIRAVDGRNVRRTAEGFRTFVRAGAIVHLEQSLRKTTGLHPEWGALQMTKGLLPAREEKLDEVADRVELFVGALLHKHGF